MHLLQPIQIWLDTIEIHDRLTAKLLVQLIPATCPFARDLWLLGHRIRIPPLCHLNPFYEQLMGLRWRSLDHLASH